MATEHKKQWEFLKNKAKVQQLSHSYLFAGEQGIGKKEFAKEFIKFIFCESNSERPCQECHSCKKIEQDAYPDFMMVKPDAGREIPISRIREVQNFLNYKSYYGKMKAVVIDDAENMNQEAQSCFLKTLEEPKGRTILILISSHPDALLPTIYSRCQQIKFFRIKERQITEKEAKVFDDLLKVIDSDLAQKFKYVKSLDPEKISIPEILDVLERYFRHLLLTKTGFEVKNNFFKNKSSDKDYSVKRLNEILKHIEDIKRKINSTNVNQKLGLEIVLMEI